MMMKRVLNNVASGLFGLYVRYKGRDAARNRAIKRAKKKHKKTGKRYRVFFLQNRYQVITRTDIQRRKHANAWQRHVNSTNLQRLCFFDTNSLKS